MSAVAKSAESAGVVGLGSVVAVGVGPGCTGDSAESDEHAANNRGVTRSAAETVQGNRNRLNNLLPMRP